MICGSHRQGVRMATSRTGRAPVSARGSPFASHHTPRAASADSVPPCVRRYSKFTVRFPAAVPVAAFGEWL